MRILILGATGRTGKLILKNALEKGFKITCLVREPKKVLEKNINLKICKGSPDIVSELKIAMHGCDTIISALNISRSSDFPWSKLITPKSFLSDVMQNILNLSDSGIKKRIVICSAWGVADSEKEIPIWFKWFIKNSNIAYAYKDHEKQEALLKNSDSNWTIIRPTGLTNLRKEQTLIESYNNEPKPNMTISRKSVSEFMLNAATEKRLIGSTIVISA